MSRRTAVYGLVLGTMTLAACAREVQGPTPVTTPGSTTPVPAPPPTAPPSTHDDAWIPGSYSMTLDIGPECDVIPAAERSRRYLATIDANLATLSGSTFLSGPICTRGTGLYAGVGCNQFFVPTNGRTVWMSLATSDDDGHGGHITEQTAAGTWMEISGTAAGKATPSGIVATGNAYVWYCPTASSYPFPCPGFVGCEAGLVVTLIRR